MNDATNESIIVEQYFDTEPHAVWDALTDRNQMVQWFFDNIPDFRAEEGFETEFNVNNGERDFHHLWKIVEVIPGRKIVYDWRYKNCPGAGKVTFEIIEEDGGARVRVTNEGLETFPQDVPEFAPDSCRHGWEYFIQGNLKDYLDRQKQVTS